MFIKNVIYLNNIPKYLNNKHESIKNYMLYAFYILITTITIK